MMSEERTHDDIDGFGASITEDIGGHPLDRGCLSALLQQQSRSIPNSDRSLSADADLYALAPSSQSVAECRRIRNRRRRCGPAFEPVQSKRLEPMEGGPVPQKPAVDFAEIAETGSHHVSTAWLVHQLCQVGAPAEVERIRRHGRASSPRSLRGRTTWRNLAVPSAHCLQDASARRTSRLRTTCCRRTPGRRAIAQRILAAGRVLFRRHRAPFFRRGARPRGRFHSGS